MEPIKEFKNGQGLDSEFIFDLWKTLFLTNFFLDSLTDEFLTTRQIVITEKLILCSENCSTWRKQLENILNIDYDQLSTFTDEQLFFLQLTDLNLDLKDLDSTKIDYFGSINSLNRLNRTLLEIPNQLNGQDLPTLQLSNLTNFLADEISRLSRNLSNYRLSI